MIQDIQVPEYKASDPKKYPTMEKFGAGSSKVLYTVHNLHEYMTRKCISTKLSMHSSTCKQVCQYVIIYVASFKTLRNKLKLRTMFPAILPPHWAAESQETTFLISTYYADSSCISISLMHIRVYVRTYLRAYKAGTTVA